jgi:hypothetical protein
LVLLLPEPWKNITAPVGCLLVGFTTLEGNNFKLMTKIIKLSDTHTALLSILNIKHVSHVKMLVMQIREIVGLFRLF